jgi:hypothetical protein
VYSILIPIGVMRMNPTPRPSRAAARLAVPGGGPQANQAFRLLDTATARLVQSRDPAEYVLSVSSQGGVLQECWLSAGRFCTDDLPAEAADSDVATAVKNGGHGPDNARAYAAALHALATLLTELVRDADYYGTASLTLRAEGGRLRPKFEAETTRRWRFDADRDGVKDAG